MCLDWNSCQEKMQPPHAGVWKVWKFIHIWATQSDGFRLRFCLQDQQHSQRQIFHVFFLTDLGPLSSRCQPIHHWMATKKNSSGSLTWLSEACNESTSGPMSIDWQVFFFPCESSANSTTFFFYHPNSGRSFSQSIFVLQKKHVPQCSKFKGTKSVWDF